MCIAFVVICIFFSKSTTIHSAKYYEKLVGYECGFDPYATAREPFNLRFYVIAIVFLLFDVEFIFVYPMLLCLSQCTILGWIHFMVFIGILLLGYAYELRIGACNL